MDRSILDNQYDWHDHYDHNGKVDMKSISAVEARKGLGMLLNRVSLRHETFVIERSGRKIAILKAYEPNPGEHAGLAEDHGGKLDLRDMAGIGADIWRTINVEDYIQGERSTWR